jgi:transcription initiation factor TFIIA large subunit
MPPANNGMPQQSYQQYGGQQAHPSNGGQRIKAEPGTEQQYNGLPNGGYAPNPVDTQGGLARAQHLVQQQYGNAASASLNAMQQRGGLALPGQQSKPPQGLQLPAGTPQAAQQQFQQQQQAAMARQQQQLHQQQSQPRIKVEGDGSTQQQNSHNYQQQQQQQQPPHPSYGQTDGADDALDEWRAQLAARRAISTEQTRQADRMMHEYAMRVSDNLENGLMVTLEEQPSHPTNKKRRGVSQKATRAVASSPSSSATAPAIPQLDGPDESDDKLAIKDEDDADAINSDLDDSDEDAGGPMGDDDDDLGDSILCTYDKVQRVKNKWKCTLKDGVMSVGGKEWVFHKGMGEFEW